MSVPVIRPCAGPCGRMTRPSKYKLADYPDTTFRMDGLYCRDCYWLAYPERERQRKEPSDVQVAQTIRAYRHWAALREQRLLRRQGPHIPPYVRQKATYQ